MSDSLQSQPTVYVVDDDASVRNSLCNLFKSVGLNAEVFSSTADLLLGKLVDTPSCLVLDVRLPGLSGLDFQAELSQANIRIPIIFMTGHGDIPMTVKAMKSGAIDFLTKPFREQAMLDAVATAIENDRRRRSEEKIVSDLRERFESLTAREREILTLVTTGMMNKQVAAETGIAEITVKVHRGRVMKKMGARSLADLVRSAELLGVHGKKS
jgi:FixJ family two-component response regulator